ncbi:hypothetical protein JXA85_03085 [Candidatus Woesearchaeota archaeon]|nr:hypothetical protein [Candidatus Woesearchaeota archaeon]
METICIPKEKLELVISDVEKLITHFEDLVGDRDEVAKQRLAEIKSGKVEAKTENELDNYLKKRGVKVA